MNRMNVCFVFAMLLYLIFFVYILVQEISYNGHHSCRTEVFGCQLIVIEFFSYLKNYTMYSALNNRTIGAKERMLQQTFAEEKERNR